MENSDKNLTPWFKRPKKSLREYKRIAETDFLTKVAVRAEVDMAMREVVDDNLPATMLMIDIDHFKKINDSIGHSAGDEVLRIIGSRLKSHFKGDDIVGRWGGEEFVAILKGEISPEVLVERAEQIRLDMEKSPIELRGNSHIVTLSIGVASRNKALNESVIDWFDRADNAVYQAKKAGRNRVVVAQSV